MNYIYAKWKWKKQCFKIIAQKISAKNMNNDLVFFRDEIKIFLISWFETRSRFVSSTSRASRRDREFVPSNLEFRDGDEILKKISRGRARYLVAKSHEIFRDRDISPCSASGWPGHCFRGDANFDMFPQHFHFHPTLEQKRIIDLRPCPMTNSKRAM